MANSYLEALLGASTGANELAAAENPYAPYAGIANQITQSLGQQGVTQKYGLGDTLIASAISGLLGGSMQQLGQNYTDTQSGLYQNALMGSIAGQNTKPEGINENLFKKAQEQASLFRLQKQIQDASSEQDLRNELQKEAIKTLAKTPKGANSILGNLFGTSTAEMQPMVKPPIESTGSGKKLKTLAELRAEAAQEAENLDITPGDKADYIGRVISPITKESERFQKELEDKAIKQRDLELTLKGADEAVSEAGNTGTIKGKIGGFIDRNILAPLGNDSAKKRNTADAVLGQLQQAGIKENKVPGAGSISDFESKKIFEASPGADNTPEQNKALLGKLKLKNELDKDYLGFMNNWLDTYGSKKGAEQAWSNYKDSAKVIIEDWDGGFTINPDRPDWRDLDLESLLDEKPKNLPITSAKPTQSTTANITQKVGRDGKTYNVRVLSNGQYEILD